MKENDRLNAMGLRELEAGEIMTQEEDVVMEARPSSPQGAVNAAPLAHAPIETEYSKPTPTGRVVGAPGAVPVSQDGPIDVRLAAAGASIFNVAKLLTDKAVEKEIRENLSFHLPGGWMFHKSFNDVMAKLIAAWFAIAGHDIAHQCIPPVASSTALHTQLHVTHAANATKANKEKELKPANKGKGKERAPNNTFPGNGKRKRGEEDDKDKREGRGKRSRKGEPVPPTVEPEEVVIQVPQGTQWEDIARAVEGARIDQSLNFEQALKVGQFITSNIANIKKAQEQQPVKTSSDPSTSSAPSLAVAQPKKPKPFGDYETVVAPRNHENLVILCTQHVTPEENRNNTDTLVEKVNLICTASGKIVNCISAKWKPSGKECWIYFQTRIPDDLFAVLQGHLPELVNRGNYGELSLNRWMTISRLVITNVPTKHYANARAINPVDRKERLVTVDELFKDWIKSEKQTHIPADLLAKIVPKDTHPKAQFSGSDRGASRALIISIYDDSEGSVRRKLCKHRVMHILGNECNIVLYKETWMANRCVMCQRWGHSKISCKERALCCDWCGEPHATSTHMLRHATENSCGAACKGQRNQARAKGNPEPKCALIKCCNCGKEHPASSSSCEFWKLRKNSQAFKQLKVKTSVAESRMRERREARNKHAAVQEDNDPSFEDLWDEAEDVEDIWMQEEDIEAASEQAGTEAGSSKQD